MIVINWSGVILDDPSLFNTIDVRNELIVVGIQNKPFKTTIKEIENEIKDAGFSIETEDYDFEDLYQIIIKIDK